MLDRYCDDFLNKCDENFELYEHLHNQGKFISWQIVAIFYSALCYAKAYLYKKGIPINSITSHDNIKYYLAVETYAKNANVLSFYENLYRASRDARYTNKKVNKNKVEYAIKNYMQVKDLLGKNY